MKDKKAKPVRRKPRVGDWFALRSPAGSTEHKVEKVERIDGRAHVTAKNTPYCYDAERIAEADWVFDADAVRDEIDLEDFKGRQKWFRTVERLWHESSRREHEIQEALGVDFLGESRRPHKKMKNAILMKSTEEAHEETLAVIKKLKKGGAND